MSFDWTREVPEGWQEDLDRLAPGERVSRLVIHWYAGFPYEPVQRWAIWEVMPTPVVGRILEEEQKAGAGHSLLAGLWNDLEGPDPRTTGTWVKDDNVPAQFGGQRWKSKSLVSRMQWDIHQRVGGVPLLCWIIEGQGGGHSWQFGPFEQSFLLAAGADPKLVDAMTEAWPNPGDLPYAEYDQRVFRALAERDLLAQWRRALSWEDRSRRTDAGLILAGEAGSRRSDMLQRTLRWLDNQISEAVSDIPRKLLPDWSAFHVTDQAPDEERAFNAILED